MRDEFLDIDVRLLVLRYGREKVIAALARLAEQSPTALEQQLQEFEQRRVTAPKLSPRPSLVELAASECGDRIEIAEPLRILAIAFENRSFLPNLRDVHRFLDRADASKQKFKSREAAGPTLIRTLSRSSTEELAHLASRYTGARESDFALLSRAIMGGTSDANNH